jgi:hypothetical protein
LLEIDTPGGRGDLAQRICGAITQLKDCPVVAFIKGGRYGGALSAGAAVALACDKIYMANDTIIGAATAITISETGRPESLKEAFGEEVGEKFASAWRAYLASLAERNGRPGLLAKAMVDRNTEVVEVADVNRRLFIDPVNKKPQQRIVHTWNKKGMLLTLTATEAAGCGIADKVVGSREELLGGLDAANAKVVPDSAIQDARAELKRASGQVDRIRKSIDLQVEQLKHQQPRSKALEILRDAKSEFQILIRLAKKYPDLRLDTESLEKDLNSVEAAYQDSRRK